MCCVATFSPTSVFPAPGTPVTKQIDFREASLDERMTSAIASEVRLRLMALASLREISETEWPPYNAIAASMMVGVGQYRPASHTPGSIGAPSQKARASSIT